MLEEPTFSFFASEAVTPLLDWYHGLIILELGSYVSYIVDNFVSGHTGDGYSGVRRYLVGFK